MSGMPNRCLPVVDMIDNKKPVVLLGIRDYKSALLLIIGALVRREKIVAAWGSARVRIRGDRAASLSGGSMEISSTRACR